MGVVGSVSAVKEIKLKEFISNPDGNRKYGDDELYMDRSFWDINYVLTEYFEEDKKMQNQNLIYGTQIIADMNKGDEVHYAYSNAGHTKQLSEIIKQYSKDDFEIYFDRALNDSKSILNSYQGDEMFRESIIMLFEKLKSLYEKASKNNLSMIYIYG